MASKRKNSIVVGFLRARNECVTVSKQQKLSLEVLLMLYIGYCISEAGHTLYVSISLVYCVNANFTWVYFIQ